MSPQQLPHNRALDEADCYPSPLSPSLDPPAVHVPRRPGMLGRVFKAYDIRGTYPDLLNEMMAWQIGYGASKYLIADAAHAGETTPMMKNIVVGRDMRTSSPSLTKQLIQGINDQGGNVIDIGMCDTSMI